MATHGVGSCYVYMPLPVHDLIHKSTPDHTKSSLLTHNYWQKPTTLPCIQGCNAVCQTDRRMSD